MPPRDEVDRIVDAWLRERPDLDFSPLQVLSRVGRLAKHLDRARRAAFTASGLDDGRGILVTMTPTGQARVDAAISQLLAAEAELLGNLSVADRERIATLLRKLSLDFD